MISINLLQRPWASFPQPPPTIRRLFFRFSASSTLYSKARTFVCNVWMDAAWSVTISSISPTRFSTSVTRDQSLSWSWRIKLTSSCTASISLVRVAWHETIAAITSGNPSCGVSAGSSASICDTIFESSRGESAAWKSAIRAVSSGNCGKQSFFALRRVLYGIRAILAC